MRKMMMTTTRMIVFMMKNLIMMIKIVMVVNIVIVRMMRMVMRKGKRRGMRFVIMMTVIMRMTMMKTGDFVDSDFHYNFDNYECRDSKNMFTYEYHHGGNIIDITIKKFLFTKLNRRIPLEHLTLLY